MSLSRKDILDFDLTKFPAVVYLAIVFFISRAPFINLGFSAFTNPTDQDVLAVVNSAYLLRYHHVYTVSRFPGYPFFEIFNSLLITGGWVLTNAATVVVSLISVVLFGKILNIFGIKNKALLLLTFAFIPVIWVNSTITMDYIWALMFILLACFQIFTGKYCIAGIAIGLAIGSRFTSAFMVIPIVYWLAMEKVNEKKILDFISSAFVTSMLLFLPVFYTYKLEFLRGSGFLYTTPVRNLDTALDAARLALSSMVTELFGIAAIVLLILFLILNFRNKPPMQYRRLLFFCWITLMIFLLLYFVFPYKVAYLIPAVPWGLIVLNEKLEKKFTIIVCILLLLNNFISIEVAVADGAHAIELNPGVVVKNYEDRKAASIEQSREYMKSLSDIFNGRAI